MRLETTRTDAGQRTIPLDPQAIAALDEYVHDSRGTKDAPLFLNARGDTFTYWGFMALFARLPRRLERSESPLERASHKRRQRLCAPMACARTSSLKARERGGASIAAMRAIARGGSRDRGRSRGSPCSGASVDGGSPPQRPAWRMSRAIRFLPQRTPCARRSSACTRGAPYVPRLRV